MCGSGMLFVLSSASALFVAYFQARPRKTRLETKCALISTLYGICRKDILNIYLYFKVNACKRLHNAAPCTILFKN